MFTKQEQVVRECAKEIIQNCGCSSEKMEAILARHGAALNLDVFHMVLLINEVAHMRTPVLVPGEFVCINICG